MFYFLTIILTIWMPNIVLQAKQSDEVSSLKANLQKSLTEEVEVDLQTPISLCNYSKSSFCSSNWAEEDEIKNFETKIAYFFGVSNEKPVIEAYLECLSKLTGEAKSIELLEKEMLPYLENAYQSIKEQRNWDFDPHLAAKIEFQIILGNFKNMPLEVIQDLMIQLYQLVFQSNSPLIQKAARLRVFLYRYKAKVLEIEGKFAEEDLRLMLEIAQTSKDFLNSIKS